MNFHCPIQNILFFTCYGGMTWFAIISCLYLLLRRNNAFATDITPPLRLRRWMAATYATVAMSHVWWMLLYYMHDGDPTSRIFLCRCLDVMINWAVTFYTMLVMLQDRRRSLWPVVGFVAIALTGLLADYHLGTQASWILMLMSVTTLLYVLCTVLVAVRQYGRWLRENYADLEHKEVWQTYLVMSAFLPTIFFYSITQVNIVFDILLEIVDILLMLVLLWRVETLQSLEVPAAETSTGTVDMIGELTGELSDDISVSEPVFAKIELMLQQKCFDTQYYLQHDVSLLHLAQQIGTNTTYLSRYFAYKGITYNTYINTLRIEHFMRLYQSTIKTRQFVTAAELSYKSGYKSYSTFGAAFKQINGQTVRVWMNKQEKQ